MIVRARGWNHEEDASPKEEAPEYKGQRGGGVGGGGLNDARYVWIEMADYIRLGISVY